MEKTYNPHAIEQQWYNTWESANYFAPQNHGDPYCIMIPPPNVTGSLHMGHGFQHCIMDTLIRYHRMQGKNTLWQTGADHAGIATQMVVERQLNAKGENRHDLGREKFIEKIWEWKAQSGNTISQQMRRLGNSTDWTRDRFTMDTQYSKAVQSVFIQLFDEKIIYRGKRLVNWDPKLLTAISDLEVLSEETNGQLWHFRYPLEDGSGHITVATTRPETILGDTAVAVHPDDKRYQPYIGKKIKLPLCDRLIPIIADNYVDSNFGSGCVKITPAHDFNDYAIGKRHQLEQINILTPDAHINENAPIAYQGLDRFIAREKVIHDLNVLGLLEKIEDHHLKIPHGDRSGAVIEPYLTDQWYVDIERLAEPARQVVAEGKIKFVPGNWINTYNQWMDNLEDWCISRQLWWGHRIPAWYDNEGNIYVAENEAAARKKYQLNDDHVLTQDEDVLDTWFSSALWPFATLGWPEDNSAVNTFYPTSVLVTGFDIIFFWVARMIMMGLKFTDQVPFHDVYITGLIRDHLGQKMSKSKGNVLDPIDLIDGIDLESLVTKRVGGLMQPAMAKSIERETRKQFPEGIPAYGTDALRFTFCALASTGRDIRFDVGRLEGYRNFCNKLWNAARFVLMNTENQDTGIDNSEMTLSLADHWIIAQLQSTIKEVRHQLDHYRFDLASHAIYEFTWNEYCDWYLELAKPILYSDESTDAAKRGTRHTLVNVLETLLRVIHPVMPFITEEIWQRIAPLAGIHSDTIMLQPYPESNADLLNQASVDELEWVKQIIIAIRTIRSEMNISPAEPLNIILHKGHSTDKNRLDNNKAFLSKLAKLNNIEWLANDATPPPSATALVKNLEIHIPLAGLINVEAETVRLSKHLEKLQAEINKSTNKLANATFIDKAPAEVVEKERTLQEANESAAAKIRKQLEKLRSVN